MPMSREADPRAVKIDASSGGQGATERRRVGAADQLFAALDGQIISAHGASGELRIFGIYLKPDRSWLQFRLSGPEQIDGVAAVECREAEWVLQRIRGGLDRRVSGSPTLVC